MTSAAITTEMAKEVLHKMLKYVIFIINAHSLFSLVPGLEIDIDTNNIDGRKNY